MAKDKDVPAWIDIPKDEVEKCKAIAQKVAKNLGFPHLTDDLAQEFIISKAKGQNRNCNHVFIDILRLEFGRFEKSAKKVLLNSHSHSVYADKSKASFGHGDGHALNLIPDKHTHIDTDPFYWLIERMDKLSERERAMLYLYFKVGLNGKELSQCFGLSEPRIGEILKALIENLKTVLEQS